jgi:hypothetical protein
MKTNKPITGLLDLAFDASKGNLIIVLAILLVAVVLIFFTGNVVAFSLVGYGAIILPVFVITMRMGAETKWESFQLTMPLRRRDLAKSLYLQVGIVSLIGVPFYIAAMAILSTTSHEALPAITVSLIANGTSSFLFAALLYAAILFPLSYTKFAHDKMTTISICILLITTVAGTLLDRVFNWATYTFEVPTSIFPVVAVCIAFVAFIASYYITKKVYEKYNF